MSRMLRKKEGDWMKKCDSCLKDFFTHELNEENFCSECQGLLQEMFDEMGWSEPKEKEVKE